jgi:hypothetical protein
MKITTTQTANFSLLEIINFLKSFWTKKELAILKNDIKLFRKILNDGIIQHETLEDYPKISFMLIAKKQVKIFYEIKENEIVVKLFWHCKGNPQTLKNFLNSF